MAHRTRAGSIYFRASDQRWCAAVEVWLEGRGRKRVVIYGTSADEVRQKLQERYPDAGRGVLETPYSYRKHASAGRDYSPSDLLAKALSTSHCRHCRTALNAFNRVKDHVRAVAEGGTDRLENIEYICWECNTAKAQRSAYHYEGAPRPFRCFPKRRAIYERFIASGEDLNTIDLGKWGLRIR